jgi:hypothetical protein
MAVLIVQPPGSVETGTGDQEIRRVVLSKKNLFAS